MSIEAPFHERLANLLIAARHMPNTQQFMRAIGRAPNYVSPASYSEKMQCRKLFDRNPLFPVFCDKLAARVYAEEADCGLKFPRLYWQGDDPDQIPFDKLPVPYIIKPNNHSGAKFAVRNGDDVPREDIRQQCRAWLDATFGQEMGEWGYRGVTGQIYVEDLLQSQPGGLFPDDYRILVFDGRVAYIQHYRGMDLDVHSATFFDRNWNRLNYRKWVGWSQRDNRATPYREDIPRPPGLVRMIDIAESLGRELDHLRVDLYDIGGEIYFGELTVYPESGFSYPFPEDAKYEGFPPHDLDDQLGALWALPAMPLSSKIHRILFS